jgi:superfamily II RNA helicase
MESVRGTPFTMIEETKRPVPLEHRFFSPRFGMMNIKAVRRKYRNNPAERKRFMRRRPSSRKIVQLVLEQGNVPVLYFCFNRKACEYNAELHSALPLLSEEERMRVRSMVDDLVAMYSLGDYEKLNYLRMLGRPGCAYHHAGMLPAAKEIVERLFTPGRSSSLLHRDFRIGSTCPPGRLFSTSLKVRRSAVQLP